MSERKQSLGVSLQHKLAGLTGCAAIVLGGSSTSEAAVVAAQGLPLAPPASNGRVAWDVDGAGGASAAFSVENFSTGVTVKAFIQELSPGRFVSPVGAPNDTIARLATTDLVGSNLGAAFKFFTIAQDDITVTASGVIGEDLDGYWSMGQTGYFGFKFTSGTDTFYGWGELQIAAAADATAGQGFTITRAYYNNTPGASIRVGQTADTVVPEPSTYALALLAAGGVAAYRSRRKPAAA